MKKESGFEIKTEERQSWVSIAMVWIGSVICVPALMIGGMLGSGLTIGEMIAAIGLGYSLICVFMIFMGMLGCDTGLPTAVSASARTASSPASFVRPYTESGCATSHSR